MNGTFLGIALFLSLFALAFVLFPLLRSGAGAPQQARRDINATVHRDRIRELEQDLENGTLSREQFDAAVEDLDRDLVQSGGIDADEAGSGGGAGRGQRLAVAGAAGLSAVAIPLLALAIYGQVGGGERAFQATSAGAGASATAAPQGASQERSREDVTQLAEQLRQRLEENPDDQRGWVLYARTMVFLERLEEARDAFSRAMELGADENADLLAEYADVLAATSGGLEGRPEELIQQALEKDPENARALWLAGTAAYNRSDYEQAEGYWQRLLEVVPQDSGVAERIRKNLEELPGPGSGGAGASAGSPDPG